jgi:hypothetical protein
MLLLFITPLLDNIHAAYFCSTIFLWFVVYYYGKGSIASWVVYKSTLPQINLDNGDNTPSPALNYWTTSRKTNIIQWSSTLNDIPINYFQCSMSVGWYLILYITIAITPLNPCTPKHWFGDFWQHHNHPSTLLDCITIVRMHIRTATIYDALAFASFFCHCHNENVLRYVQP